MPVASFVVAMGIDGQIISQGSPSETLCQNQALAEEMKHEQEALELDDDFEREDDDTQKSSAKGAKVSVCIFSGWLEAYVRAVGPCGGRRTRTCDLEGCEITRRQLKSLADYLLGSLAPQSLVRPWPWSLSLLFDAISCSASESAGVLGENG
jgi:hypothetical protein